jgi:hypothetical protein
MDDKYASIKTRKARLCSNCQCEIEVNAEGPMGCASCGIVDQGAQYDNNVVFGEERALLGKNVNKQGTYLVMAEKLSQVASQRRLKRAAGKIQDLVKKLGIPSDYQKS